MENALKLSAVLTSLQKSEFPDHRIHLIRRAGALLPSDAERWFCTSIRDIPHEHDPVREPGTGPTGIGGIR